MLHIWRFSVSMFQRKRNPMGLSTYKLPSELRMKLRNYDPPARYVHLQSIELWRRELSTNLGKRLRKTQEKVSLDIFITYVSTL